MTRYGIYVRGASLSDMTMQHGKKRSTTTKGPSPIPYDSLDDKELNCALRFLELGWRKMLEEKSKVTGWTFREEEENTLTRELVLALERLLDESKNLIAQAFMKDFLPVVSRHEGYFSPSLTAKQKDALKALPKKKREDASPDITFRPLHCPSGARSHYRVHIEAKMITLRSNSSYSTRGVARFVTGSYAGAMKHGVMIGYIVDTYSSCPVRLHQYFSGGRGRGRARDNLTNQFVKGITLEIEGCASIGYTSVHRRPWTYPGSHNSPGEISIRHLWLGSYDSKRRYNIE